MSTGTSGYLNERIQRKKTSPYEDNVQSNVKHQHKFPTNSRTNNGDSLQQSGRRCGFVRRCSDLVRPRARCTLVCGERRTQMSRLEPGRCTCPAGDGRPSLCHSTRTISHELSCPTETNDHVQTCPCMCSRHYSVTGTFRCDFL